MNEKPFLQENQWVAEERGFCHCPHCGVMCQGEGWEDVLEGRSLRYCEMCKLPILLLAGKYRLLHRLKEGNKNLYLAQHKNLGVERVVKFIQPTCLQRERCKRQFLREVELTACMSSRNNHIVRVYDDFGEVPQLGYFYVMEYLHGHSLATLLKNQPLPIPLVTHIFHQLCDALSTAHRSGIVHRNLNPENIYLIQHSTNTHFVKVTNFEVARSQTDPLTPLPKQSGSSPSYLSPEQSLQRKIDHRTDTYALGAILYEMVTGAAPDNNECQTNKWGVQSQVTTQQTQPILFPSERCPTRSIPEILEAITRKALKKEMELRFQSVEEILSLLEPILASPPRSSQSVEQPCPPTREFSIEINRPWRLEQEPFIETSLPSPAANIAEEWNESETYLELDAPQTILSSIEQTPPETVEQEYESAIDSADNPTISMSMYSRRWIEETEEFKSIPKPASDFTQNTVPLCQAFDKNTSSSKKESDFKQ